MLTVPALRGSVETRTATHIVEMSCPEKHVYVERRVYCPYGVTCGTGCACNEEPGRG